MLSDMDLLIKLAKTTRFRESRITTSNYCKTFNVSQQSISRRLIDLEKSGLILRNPSTDGIIVKITAIGRSLLYENLTTLKKIFNEYNPVLEGKVVTGVGEGKYYLSKTQYRKKIKKALGFSPYAGTLNLKVSIEKSGEFIENLQEIIIAGFSDGKRTYGKVYSYKILIKNVKAAIIVPKRTHHSKDIIEIIAPIFLRKKLKLNDGDKITLKPHED